MPAGFASTPDGLLLIADGFGPMMRWDSFKAQAEPAGVLPPTSAVVMTGSGSGNIVGTYTAYLRFVDDRGNFSNLSPISAELVAAGPGGAVFGATAATPIVIDTLVAHGLATGQRVKISGVGGNTDANGTWDIIVLSPTTFSLTGSSGNTAYSGGGTWQSGLLAITYLAVFGPAEPKVVRRQILRNTDGQARTYYVDVDTTDLTSPSFVSTRIDSDLQAQEAVALVGDDGTSLANLNTVPPATKSVLAHHLGRMFAAVEVEYAEGAVAVTLGSAAVTGLGTEWTPAVAGRFLYVNGATEIAEILSVDVDAQTLTLTAPYTGNTNAYAAYAIRPAAEERRGIAYTEAGLPESWPATNVITLPEDGDVLTGLMPFDSFLYVLERDHVYRFTMQEDPATDGEAFLAETRGCINNRCWIIVEDSVYMLDRKGVHKFLGNRDNGSDVSTPIQTLFRPDGDPSINWAASRFFHATLDSAQETIRWFVALSGQYLPRHALCYAYNLDRWWLEEYPFPVGCSAVGKLARQASLGTWGVGREQVFYGTRARKVAAFAAGPLDGYDHTLAAQHTGAVVSSTTDSLTAAQAFDATAVGCTVAISAGRGKGQVRLVRSVSGSTARLKTPWLVTPDATSTFQLGAIPWEYRSGWFRWADDEDQNVRRIELMFEPTEDAQRLTLRRYRDRSDTPIAAGITRNDDGVQSVAGSPDLTVSLDRNTGFVQTRLDGGKELYTHGPRLIQVGLSGFGGREPAKVFQITLDGVREPG